MLQHCQGHYEAGLGLGHPPAKHTGTLTTGLVLRARDNRVHELPGWSALVMKGDFRIFERV